MSRKVDQCIFIRLKDQLLNGSEADKIILKDIFNEYQKLFGTEKPLGLKEFYTVLKIAFPQPPSVEESFNGPVPVETVLCNVKLSPTRRRDGKRKSKKLLYYTTKCECIPLGPICHWNECNQSFDSPADLHKHIIQTHLDNQTQCHWMKCTRALDGKQNAIQHMRTHFASKTKKQIPTKQTFTVAKIPVDESEVSGIPLTSALLLRNLARNKQHHTYYLPYESELTLLAIQRPKVSRYILTVLGELQAN